ncbi:hypothetical protein OG458_42825 (plasmid) [Streptomyces sp. NBC_01281]|uniref:hypothetical protein n=1 Tax=Streptomyces sp. NBC_01281 TaxID=2903811 RepID=UPI002E0E7E16|nr:hypothetical protein OG458_42825 [Streptomyces sp. NBC_01281]
MSRVRQNTRGNTAPASAERLPQRWGIILTAAVVMGAVAFMAGGPLAALGAIGVTIGTLHAVLA